MDADEPATVARPRADAADSRVRRSVELLDLFLQLIPAAPGIGIERKAAKRHQRGHRRVDDERRGTVEAERQILFVLVLGPERAPPAVARGDGGWDHDRRPAP